MAEVRLSEADVAALMARLDALGEAAADLMGAWPEVGRLWAERERRVFATGRGWAPLAASTLRRKRGLSGGRPLVRTGRLLADAARVVRATPTFAVLGVSDPAVRKYGHWHVRGAGVPKRDPVPQLTASEREEIVKVISDHITEALRAGA